MAKDIVLTHEYTDQQLKKQLKAEKKSCLNGTLILGTFKR